MRLAVAPKHPVDKGEAGRDPAGVGEAHALQADVTIQPADADLEQPLVRAPGGGRVCGREHVLGDQAPMIQDPAGQSFARSRASVVRQLTDAMRKAEVQAMVWPTMPFNATPIDGKWPKIQTTLSYNNWLGLPEVSVPSGYDADGMPALNLSVVGFPGDDLQVLALAHAYEQQSRMFRFPLLR